MALCKSLTHPLIFGDIEMLNLELLLELVPYLSIGLMLIIGSVRDSKPVTMTRVSVRARIRRFCTNFYDPSMYMRIGRSTWCGPRVGRLYVAHSEGARKPFSLGYLILAFYSGPCGGVTNLDRRGPLALSMDHGSRTLSAYATLGPRGLFAKICPIARTESTTVKTVDSHRLDNGITTDLDDFTF